MPGIYIHIPFCKKKCHYCNFYSSTLLRYKPDFIEALLKEIDLRNNYLSSGPVQTIYIGGGTPSLLPVEDLTKIFDKLYDTFQITNDAEITLETNPDDLTEQYLSDLRRLPLNRLSIGIQSFYDDDLHFLNRIHSSKQALISIERSQNKGFTNLSIDLIYGIPTLTGEKWAHNLQRAFTMNIPHISAYALTVESKTALEQLILKGKIQHLDETIMVEHFHLLCDQMDKNGYTHYEISNFCKDNQFARHNVSYWTDESYLGLGPAAHSYNGNSRQWNQANVKTYIESLAQDHPDFELELLNPNQHYNEYVMTSLRTIWGCNVMVVQEKFGNDLKEHLLCQAKRWIDSGHLIHQAGILMLTRSGQLFADKIASEMFMVDD